MNFGMDGRAGFLYKGTGIGTYTYELLKALNLLDDLNRYVIFMNQSCDLDMDFKNNFSLISYNQTITDNFWDTISFGPSLKDKKLDLYHNPQNGIGLPKTSRVPIITTLHDIIPLKMPETVSDKYLAMFSQNINNILKASDAIITVSNYSKEDIAKTLNYPYEKIYVTPLASQNVYKPIDKFLAKSLIKRRYKINKDFLLYVGGFSPRKNILGLLEAFSMISKNNPNLLLVIAGTKGKSYDIYKNKVTKLGISSKVLFPGFIPLEDLNNFYNGAEAFVYPSFYEGFGLPPLEAMACGTPVIASNTTSIPEVLGDSALLVDPYDILQLKEAILRILEDKALRQTLIFKGFVKNSKLTWGATAKKTLKVYENISAKLK